MKQQDEGLKKLHFGQSHENQRTHEILASGRDVRDTKAPLAHSRFSDWITSKVATGELAPDIRAEKVKLVSEHKFRDRVKLAEIGERSFGVYYETERQRIDRHLEEQQSQRLPREAWFKNQHAPACQAPVRKPTGTALTARHFTDAERINASVEDLGRAAFDMHAGHGWKGAGIPKFRPKLPETFGGENVKPFDHDHGDFVWHEPVHPNSVVEPYQAFGKEKKAEGSEMKSNSKNRFDFNSKTDGRSRLNFQLVNPAPKPEPTVRTKRYTNSLKGVTCFLPHSMTAGFSGDREVCRQAKELIQSL